MYNYVANYEVYSNGNLINSGHKIFTMESVGIRGFSEMLKTIQENFISKNPNIKSKDIIVLITNVINLDTV